MPDVWENIKQWLEEGRIDAENPEEMSWKVVEEWSDENKKHLVALTPLLPIPLYIFYDREAEVIRIVAETGIKTWAMDLKDRASLYHFLLRLNKIALVKVYLFGDEDEVAIVGDLSAKSLGKEEFLDTLKLLMIALTYIYDKYGFPEEKEEELLEITKEVIAELIKKGEPRDKIVSVLVRSGMSKRDAEELVREVEEQILERKTTPPGVM